MHDDDHVYWNEVHDFLDSYPDGPAAHASPEVARLVANFFFTSGALEMEVCLAKIHYKVNLRGYLDADFLVDLTYNATLPPRKSLNMRPICFFAYSQANSPDDPSCYPPYALSTPTQSAVPALVPATKNMSQAMGLSNIKQGVLVDVKDRAEWRFRCE